MTPPDDDGIDLFAPPPGPVPGLARATREAAEIAVGLPVRPVEEALDDAVMSILFADTDDFGERRHHAIQAAAHLLRLAAEAS